ncbi:MAG: hypothetical protein R6W76_17655, partial [Caldilinea sp.]
LIQITSPPPVWCKKAALFRWFETELDKLQVELVKLQERVTASGARICVLTEERRETDHGSTWR